MRITARQHTPTVRPNFGDVRVVRRFLLLPRKMRNPENGRSEWRWMETAHWREEYRLAKRTLGWETVSEWLDTDIPLMPSQRLLFNSKVMPLYVRRDLEGAFCRGDKK